MAIDWNQYPTDTGINNTTGRPNVDPTSLQFDPSQTAVSSPLNPANGGSGGIDYTGGTPIPPGYTLQNAPGGDTPGSNWGYAPGPTSPPSTGGSNAQAYYQSLFPPGSRVTPQDLLAHKADLAAHGITLINNAEGLPGKISLADGSAFDVIQGAGTGNGISQWSQIAGPGGSTGTLSGIGGTNQFGQSMGFMTAPFVAPTADQAMQEPGVQFGLEEANRMMQNSAAAKGTLLNGRFQQALAASNIGNAMQDYGNIYNRAYQTFTRNQDAPFNKFTTLADLGQRAASAS